MTDIKGCIAIAWLTRCFYYEKLTREMSTPARCTAIVFVLTLQLLVTTSFAHSPGREVLDSETDVSVIQLKSGEPLLTARTRILRHGWKPVRMHLNDGYEYDGAEKRLKERGLFEVDSCSIDAGANCTLYYRKANKCLRIDTLGEQVNDMKVSRWTKECPTGNDYTGAE